jgi:ATP/maltotriose-dependent transcriptional regulator MalT/DNA-binding SARP family transcriptional activator
MQADMIPLLQSKLTIPEIPYNVLYSQRIKDLQIAKKRLVIITAPAGFGKTTAVLLSLKKEKANVRWYRMEKEDSFLPVFYTHLIELLFLNREKSSLECCRTLNSIQNIMDEYPLLNAQICQDFSIAVENRKEKLYLVFDDFHTVMGSSALIKSIQYFAVNLPPEVSIVVTSRVETGILVGKLAIQPDILAVNAENLRFTREDTEKLIRSSYKLDFTSEEMEQVYSYSEGWVTGLYIICQSDHPLAVCADDERPLDSVQDRFDRFFNEFILDLDENRRTELSKISILPDFSEYELKKIFDIEQPDELINWLEKSNLYIQKMLMKPARYRFHSLFRKQLLNALYTSFEEEQIRGFYIKAASYYKNTGSYNTAIRLLLYINEVSEAVEIAKSACTNAFNTGHTELIAGALSLFPELIIQNNAYLLFFKSVILININHDQCYQSARLALLMFNHQKDMSYLMNAFGMVMIVAFQTNDFSYLKSVAGYLPKLRVIMAGGIPMKKLMIAGISSVVADEKLKLGAFLYKLFGGMKITDPLWDYSFLMIRGILLYRIGDLKESLINLDQVMKHPVGLAHDQWRITGIVSCHLAACLAPNTAKSNEMMTELFTLAEKYDSDFARGFAYRMVAMSNYQCGNPAQAMLYNEKASDAFRKSGSPNLECICNIMKYLWDEEPSKAEQYLHLAETELLRIPRNDIGHGFDVLAKSMVGAIAKRACQFEKAEELLMQALAATERKGSRQNICGTLLHLADLYLLSKDSKHEQYYLSRWAHESKIYDYVFFWEMNYITLVRVCARAIEKRICVEHMQKIIAVNFGAENVNLILDQPEKAVVSPQEFIEGCRKFEKKTRIVYVKLFGSLKLAVAGETINEIEWKTRKISGILKYILAHNDKPVSRETLVALFWPDSDAKAAFTSLRVALYELRKILAQFSMGFESENALIAESKAGFKIAKGNIIQTDIQEFSVLYSKLKEVQLSSDDKENILWRMNELYEGDFLEETPYDDWASLEREHYKSIFIESSYALGRILINRNSFDQAEKVLNKHMLIDPFDEKACAMLIHIYETTNQSMRANALKRQFEKRYKTEFGEKANLAF